MTDDKMPIELDKLFALLGRVRYALHATAHALARSEEIRARLEDGAEFQNDERNRLLEKFEGLRARLREAEEEIEALKVRQKITEAAKNDALGLRDTAVAENKKMALTLKLWGGESARQEKEISALRNQLDTLDEEYRQKHADLCRLVEIDRDSLPAELRRLYDRGPTQ